MYQLINKTNSQWVIILFIATLLVQVNTVFACSMMPEQTSEHRCADQVDIKTDHHLTKDNTPCCDIQTNWAISASAQSNNNPIDDQALTADYFTLSLPLLGVAITLFRAPSNSAYPYNYPYPAATHIYQSTERYRI